MWIPARSISIWSTPSGKLQLLRAGSLPGLDALTKVVGIIPVHVAGVMIDMAAVNQFAARHNLWVVEDAAHSFPAAWRAATTMRVATLWRRYFGGDLLFVLCK